MTDQYLSRADEYKKKYTLKIGAGLDHKGAKAALAAERLRETEERRLKKKKIRDQKAAERHGSGNKTTSKPKKGKIATLVAGDRHDESESETPPIFKLVSGKQNQTAIEILKQVKET